MVDIEEYISFGNNESYAVKVLLLGGGQSLIIRHPRMSMRRIRSRCRAISRERLFRPVPFDHGVSPTHPYLLCFQLLQNITSSANLVIHYALELDSLASHVWNASTGMRILAPTRMLGKSARRVRSYAIGKLMPIRSAISLRHFPYAHRPFLHIQSPLKMGKQKPLEHSSGACASYSVMPA